MKCKTIVTFQIAVRLWGDCQMWSPSWKRRWDLSLWTLELLVFVWPAWSFFFPQTLSLTCTVCGDPKPQVSWLKNGTEVEPDDQVKTVLLLLRSSTRIEIYFKTCSNGHWSMLVIGRRKLKYCQHFKEGLAPFFGSHLSHCCCCCLTSSETNPSLPSSWLITLLIKHNCNRMFLLTCLEILWNFHSAAFCCVTPGAPPAPI